MGIYYIFSYYHSTEWSIRFD